MDRYAIISDIHSNQAALEVVLADIEQRGIEKVFCLGDVIGYGPDPEWCADQVRERCAVTIRGNHEEALFKGPARFNAVARDAIKFTRDRLRPRMLRGKHTSERWSWIEGLPEMHRHNRALLVHGSPNDPINEYVYQEDITFGAKTKLRRIFNQTDMVTFCGHTHLPVVISRIDGALATFVPRGEESEFVYEMREDAQYIVNVGSVGQPRDRDSRSCYVEVDGTRIIYRRLEYDISATQAKIAKVSLLDEFLGLRLERGM